MQYFVKPGSDDEWLKTWKDIRINWFKELGVNPEKLRLKQHHEKELAHYAKDAYDVEYEFPFGWQELEGIHNRTDFDLKRHTEYSGKPINYFDEEAKERYVPYIIETSVGLNRTLLTCLVDAYREEEGRVVLSLSPKIAPIKAAIMPLVKRDGMDTIAYDLYNKMRNTFKVFYDVSGSIGRRYRRQDEAGTPFCVTVDSQTLEDNTVTIRERDSMKQERYAIGDVIGIIEKAVSI